MQVYGIYTTVATRKSQKYIKYVHSSISEILFYFPYFFSYALIIIIYTFEQIRLSLVLGAIPSGTNRGQKYTV